MKYEKLHKTFKENSIHGRYVNLDCILPLLELWKDKFEISSIGNSVEGRPIFKCEIGIGKIKVLMWSQMHGNESTTTKALVDFMNFLNSESDSAKHILDLYSFTIIPILNPDGAEVYTRVNANGIDLNRDFQNLTQPESQLLMEIYTDFKPNYCYNLHDQRTIFGVGSTGKSATVSFLAPSYNDDKDYNTSRLKAVEVLMKMAQVLDVFIPGHIGRFNDGFNLNCVGDTFQALGTPTVLIEAGHFPNDYEREHTRKFIFIALLAAFYLKNDIVIVDDILGDYLRIPQNMPNFYDFVYKNVLINYEDSDIITNFAVQYTEELIDNKVVFNGFIAKIGNFDDYFAHYEYDAKGAVYSDKKTNIPKLEARASFFLITSLNLLMVW